MICTILILVLALGVVQAQDVLGFPGKFLEDYIKTKKLNNILFVAEDGSTSKKLNLHQS